eukprot:TRINITY_DN6873_c0_g2_i1.p1 TRINITY_DN6873_c0_g2~~TRINITY_DN6873_c0_g2_i1.p1  ORF type:complete len:597 (-),score=97.78 TRINITY_DN6873_c0_g2_i1:15-1775(-)
MSAVEAGLADDRNGQTSAPDFLNAYEVLRAQFRDLQKNVAANSERLTSLLSQQDAIVVALQLEAVKRRKSETVGEKSVESEGACNQTPPGLPNAPQPPSEEELSERKLAGIIPYQAPGVSNAAEAALRGRQSAARSAEHEQHDACGHERRERLHSMLARSSTERTQRNSAVYSADSRKNTQRKVFADAEALKQSLRNKMFDDHTSAAQDPLHSEGLSQAIVRSQIFQTATFVMLASNAIWTGVDMELNPSSSMFQAEAAFLITEMIFFIFFTFEWAVRLGAFQVKTHIFRDYSFLFDSVLVFIMWVEMLVLSIFASSSEVSSSTAAFSFLRLFRLTRMARMARLLRTIPELMMIVRAIAVALRSVAFALVLLVGLVYIFGMIFTQVMDGKNAEPGTVAYDHFRSLPHTMNTLLLLGALPDQGEMVTNVAHVNWGLYPLMLLYVFMASLTIMNMLIGILCDVVTVVAQVEKEEMLIKQLEITLSDLLCNVDADSNKHISRQEFVMLLTDQSWIKALSKLNVDLFGLIDLTDFIFDKHDNVKFSEFMEMILQLRGTNTATVKDIVDLRKLMKENHERIESMLRSAGVT